MKLNPDCVRDTLLTLESLLTISVDPDMRFVYCTPKAVVKEMTSKGFTYSPEDIVYTLIQLSKSGYIDTDFSRSYRGIITYKHVYYITPKGHDLLSSISNSSTWKEKILPVLGKIGGFSLALLQSVAISVVERTFFPE